VKFTLVKFQDCFPVKGVKGGERAVDKLLSGVQSHLNERFPDSDNWAIFVKAYANVEGLAQALARTGRITSAAEFRLFVTEFTSRHAFCDFVDVGHGKERADNKVKGE
jgi:hypothetical protein